MIENISKPVCDLSRSQKFITITFCFLLTAFYSFAQDSIHIRGQLQNNTRFAKVVVQKFGIGSFDIAALPIDKETGSFSIIAPADVEPGIYRFRYSQTGYGDFVDVIINGKEKLIEWSVDVSLEPDNRNPIFTTSDENKAWRLFQAKQKETLNAIRIKEDFLSRYPSKSDKSYQSVLKDYEKAKKNYLKQYQEFVNKTPFYWAQAQARFNQVYFTNISEHPRLQLFNAHEHFWVGKPTTDSLLLNTPLYTDAILSYVNYYMNPEMEFGEEEQKAGYKKCVDKIIQVFGDNEATKEFAIKYLQLGFKELANEKVLQYIDENYAVNEQCTADDAELKKRLEAYEKLKPGSQVPNISFIDTSGKNKTLKDYTHENIVLVFWASWCPHCMQEMPKLEEWAKQNPQSLVIAISLDDDFNSFQNAIKVFPSMLHYCDLQKWNGEIVSQFNVMATPTIFWLDKNKVLLDKFSSFETFITNSK